MVRGIPVPGWYTWYIVPGAGRYLVRTACINTAVLRTTKGPKAGKGRR